MLRGIHWGKETYFIAFESGIWVYCYAGNKRSGVDAQIFNLSGALLGDQILAKRRLSGNDLLALAETYIHNLETEGGKIPENWWESVFSARMIFRNMI